MVAAAALGRGDSGEEVRDLQLRLGRVGHAVPASEVGQFGDATEAAVRAFQDARGITVDGVCGAETWGALVESEFTLGDRMLYFRRPMLRGDDVAQLQRSLNAMGFDAGREDGILGEQTAAAVGEFQRNTGLAVDAICGPATVAALRRVVSMAGGSVATVRERETLRRGPRGLAGRRVYVVAAAGLEALGETVSGDLTTAGADAVLDVSGGDESSVAAAANRFEAELFLALRPAADPASRCTYFASGEFRSEAGYRVAAAVQAELTGLLGTEPEVAGRAYGLLRETRMAAVVCELVEHGDIAAMRQLVTNAGAIGRAIVRGARKAYEATED